MPSLKNEPLTGAEFEDFLESSFAPFVERTEAFQENITAFRDRSEAFQENMKAFQDRMLKFQRDTESHFVRIEEANLETRRHMGVLHEATQHKLDLLIEGFGGLPKRTTDLENRLDAAEDDIAVLKVAVGSRGH